jgi:hypothetical protein
MHEFTFSYDLNVKQTFAHSIFAHKPNARAPCMHAGIEYELKPSIGKCLKAQGQEM